MAFKGDFAGPERPRATAGRACPVVIHCLNCGSDRLDVRGQPRGDDIVECLCCGDWNRYLDLELATVETIRHSMALRRRATHNQT